MWPPRIRDESDSVATETGDDRFGFLLWDRYDSYEDSACLLTRVARSPIVNRMKYRTAESIPSGIGDSVRAVLLEKHVSQRQLAARIGLSQPAVQRRLSGRVEFKASELRAVSDLTGVPVADLIREV